MAKRRSHRTKRPWRMRAWFVNHPTKTIAYSTEAAARRSAAFEESCGAFKTRTWKEGEFE